LVYPPKNVVVLGTPAILRFLRRFSSAGPLLKHGSLEELGGRAAPMRRSSSSDLHSLLSQSLDSVRVFEELPMCVMGVMCVCFRCFLSRVRLWCVWCLSLLFLISTVDHSPLLPPLPLSLSLFLSISLSLPVCVCVCFCLFVFFS
jgi:hypothetical protein